MGVAIGAGIWLFESFFREAFDQWSMSPGWTGESLASVFLITD
jgi:hypothetical protein